MDLRRCQLFGADGKWIGLWEAEYDLGVGDTLLFKGTPYLVRQVLPNESNYPIDTWAMVVSPPVILLPPQL